MGARETLLARFHHPRPEPTMPPELRYCELTGDTNHLPIVPRRIGDQVVKRLVARPNTSRIQLRGHWLDALTIAGQEQATDISPKRITPIGVPNGCCQF